MLFHAEVLVLSQMRCASVVWSPMSILISIVIAKEEEDLVHVLLRVAKQFCLL